MENKEDKPLGAKLDELGQYIEKLIMIKIGNNFNEAARFIGISSAELFSLRKGERKNPSPRILALISEKLNGDYAHMMQLAGYNVPGTDIIEQLVDPIVYILCSDKINMKKMSQSLGENLSHEKACDI
jgi:hypothetical protein